MVVRAVRLFAVGAVLTLLRLQEVRVVFLLLPPVTVSALVLIRATLLVRADKVVHLPVRTHLALVSECGGSSAEVLPIMSVHADLAVVVVFSVRTPHCLKQEHVEVHVDMVLFDQLDGELPVTVSERAEFLIVAWGSPRLEIRRAKLCLVLVGVVELLDTVVSPIAAVAFAAPRDLA